MSSRIVSVDAFAITYQVAGRFKFFEGPRGRPPGRPAVVVKVTDEDGSVGWGQCVPSPRWSYETVESVLTTITNYLAPELAGLDSLDQDGIRRVMDRAIAASFSTGQPICKAGLDLALHDLTGRRLGCTLADRWGLRGRDRITLSWTLNPKTLDEVEGLIQQGWDRGYRHFNVKIAPDPAFDLELCRIARRRVPNSFLWADANGGYDLATAMAVAPKLADAGVDVFEQPIPANRLTGLRRLRRQGALPIILDEGVVSAADLTEYIRLGLLDGVAIKHARCGGLAEARRQIELLRDAGLMFLGSGLTDPDLSLAAALALYGAYDLQYPAALNGPQFLAGSILAEPFAVVDGQLAIPSGPGLGVGVDEGRLHEMVTDS